MIGRLHSWKAEVAEKRDGMMMTMMMETIAMKRKVGVTRGRKRRGAVEKGSGKVEKGDVRLLGGGSWAAQMGLGESWHEVNDIR